MAIPGLLARGTLCQGNSPPTVLLDDQPKSFRSAGAARIGPRFMFYSRTRDPDLCPRRGYAAAVCADDSRPAHASRRKRRARVQAGAWRYPGGRCIG
jgi:hypothetical protein